MAELLLRTIAVTGTDATTFLNGQLSQLVADKATWTLVLDPDGTVVTLGFLEPASDGWTLSVPAALCAATITRLKRFTLRTKVAIDETTATVDCGLESTDQLFDRRWPWAEECTRGVVPHTFGQRFVDATVSFTKGCFTGQELVGRLDARGANVPWRLAVVTAPTLELARGVFTVGPEGPKGETRHRNTGDGVQVMGIVHRTALVPADPLVRVEAAD